jgi:hypothetical protein
VRSRVRVRYLPAGRPAGNLERMGVIASIDSTSVTAEPGAEASCSVRVRNTGMIVDQVLLDVLGDAKSWSTVEPAQLNLLPGTDALARVVFRPPRSAAVPAGPVPFAVRAMSQEDPGGSTIEEGAVEVSPFSDLSAKLVPGTARGRRRARYRLVVDNGGNSPVHAAVSVADPDDALEFRVKPDTLMAQPGTATFVRLRVAPKTRFLKGPDRTLPFQALVQADECVPEPVNGVMAQEQILPRWLLPAIAVVAAAAAALVALWFAVLKPQVHSMATEAVTAATQQMTSSAAKASQAAQQASQAAQRANTAADAASGTAGAGGKKKAGGTGGKPGAGASPAPSASASASGGAAAGSAAGPVSSMLQANPSPSATFAAVPFAVPAKQTLRVTDIVLENPLGDTGLLQIRAGGKTLFTFGLANFRSIDYHFVQPLVFNTASPLVLAVQCQNAGGKACSDELSFSGTLGK